MKVIDLISELQRYAKIDPAILSWEIVLPVNVSTIDIEKVETIKLEDIFIGIGSNSGKVFLYNIKKEITCS